MPTLDDLFNDHKVHRRLAAMLPVGQPRDGHVDRYSLAQADGIVTQVLMTTGRWASDPDVAAYLGIDPADTRIWDPAQPQVLADAVVAAAVASGLTTYGAVWVRGRDVHPNCRHNDVVAALVLLGSTLFTRATTSAVVRAVRRPDGPDENTYTLLLTQLVRHYDLSLLRFDEDTTRAARDELSSGILADTCLGRGTKVQFGTGQIWNPQDPNHQQMLKILLGAGMVDDVARRRRLMGKRLLKLQAGGCPMSERQLPHGYEKARDGDGALIKENGKGSVVAAQSAFVPVLQELVKLHAAGASYVALGRRMADLGVERRGQKQNGVPTLAELRGSGDSNALAEAAKSFFVNSSASPTRELDVYLQKVRLWRTGVFYTEVENEIRGRGIQVAGMTPTYRSKDDEYGYFPVSVSWPWPIDPDTGQVLIGWGVTAELEKSEARLVREIGAPRRTGGAAHRRPTRRAVTPSEWTDGGMVHSVQPRQHNSGRNSCVIFSNTIAGRGRRRGWSVERGAPQTHALATFTLTDLCGSLASAIERTVLELLTPGSVATVTLPERDSVAEGRAAQARLLEELGRKLEANRNETLEKEEDKEAKELLLESRKRAQVDSDAVARLERRVTELAAEITRLDDEREGLQRAVAVTRAKPADAHGEDTLDASLNVAAYLVAGLRRAQAANGLGPAALADLVAEHVTAWSMKPGGKAVRWRAHLRLPLIAGGFAECDLDGVIDNVRSATGGRGATSGEVLAEQVLVERRPLSELALASGVETSRRALVTKHLMPWLKARGVTSRGACCALIEHPVPGVGQLLFGHLTGGDSPVSLAWPRPLTEHVITTFIDPGLLWGFAACPDDTVLIQCIVDAVAAAGPDGLRIDDLAAASGRTRKEVRELAHPYDRPGGFTRPRYLELHPDHPDRLRALRCTYCPGRERPLAVRVCLLPEVAVSGYGVLCACGRVPMPRRHPEYTKWRRLAFPEPYTTTLFTRVARTSLRDEPQTGPAGVVPTLVLPRRAR